MDRRQHIKIFITLLTDNKYICAYNKKVFYIYFLIIYFLIVNIIIFKEIVMPWSLKTTPNKNYTNTICMFEVLLMNKMHRKRIFIF